MGKRLRPWESIHEPNQYEQNVEEEEEDDDVSSGSSISGCSSDLTSSSSSSSDNEDSSSASDDEVDSVKVDVSLKEACEDATGKLCLRYQKQLQNAFKRKKPTQAAWISTWKQATSLSLYGAHGKQLE